MKALQQKHGRAPINRAPANQTQVMGRGRPQKATAAAMRALAKQPAGPWERRVITLAEREAFAEATGLWSVAREMFRDECFVNGHYSVQVSDEPTPFGVVVHLWIRRHDGERIRTWAALQRIKTEIVGPERVAVEVFPAESELVDAANMFHLWVLPEGQRLPFTLRGPTP